jgi:hypothetical protein
MQTGWTLADGAVTVKQGAGCILNGVPRQK